MKRLALWRAAIPPQWLLFFVVVVDLVGFGIVIPILPFLSPRLGGDAQDVAYIIVIYSICAGVVAPFWGRLSDRIGRKPVLMICLLGGALSYVMLGFASSLWMVYASRAFAGLVAGNLAVATAMMADLSTPEKRAKSMGLIGTAFGLGLVLGPFFGGLLSGDAGQFYLPCVFAGGVSLLAVFFAAVLLPSDTRSRTAKAEVAPAVSLLALLRREGNPSLLLQYLFHTFAVSSAIYLLPLWSAALLNWGPKEVGVFFGVVGVAMILVQGVLLGWLTRQLGMLPLLRIGVGIFAMAVIFGSGAVDLWPMVITMLLAFTGATVCLPMLNTIASSVVTASERGQMMGATSSAAAFGRVVGPLATSLNLALWGYRWAWLGVAAVLGLVWLWSITGAKRYADMQH